MSKTIILVDDNLDYLSLMSDAIAKINDIDVVAIAVDFDGGVNALHEHEPDIILSGLFLGKGDSGIDLIRTARRTQPKLQTMIVTNSDSEDYMFAALGVGAKGYLLKDMGCDSIVCCLQEMIKGDYPVSPLIDRRLDDNYHGIYRALDDTPLLSKKELAVLTMLSKGLSRKEIAEIKGLSPNTIATYIKRMYAKLGVSSKTEAVFEAVQLGLISLNRQ